MGFLMLLPIMYKALFNHPKIFEYDLSSVVKCTYGMTPMDQHTLEKGLAYLGAAFQGGTGQTEFLPSTNSFKPKWQLKKQGNYWGESTLIVDTRIMDDAGNLLPPGQVGEIVWRGPAVMAGYLKDPEATEEVWKHGWHHSGDLGYVDEDGLIVFVDRKKDMIKTGGENVPSIKVEKHLLSDPRIEEVAIVGLPHEYWGEAVTAFVKPAQGVHLTEEAFFQDCVQGLGGFERPKRAEIVDELPKTSTGKIRKNELRHAYADLYREGEQ
jgi:long-chain acyl-CoA synthetase